MILAAMCAASLLHLCSVAALPADAPRSPCRPGPQRLAFRSLRVFGRRAFLCFTLSAFLGRVSMMAYYGFFSLYLRDVHGFSAAGNLQLTD